MTPKWLIDAYNLMHLIPSIADHLDHNPGESYGLLAGLVEEYCRKKGSRARLIIDGYPQAVNGHFPHVSLSYSKSKTADEYIYKQIQKDNAARQWIVVSNDREILDEARKMGIQTVRSSQFKQQITAQKRKASSGNRSRPVEKQPDVKVSDKEVERMLKFYKLRDKFDDE